MTDLSASVLKALFITCFAFLILLVVWHGIILLFFVSIGGTSKLGGLVLLGMLISVVGYFRWPWIAALVSWLKPAQEFHDAMPWERHSLGFLSVLSVALFVVAHTGAICHLILQHRKTALAAIAGTNRK